MDLKICYSFMFIFSLFMDCALPKKKEITISNSLNHF
jgi:hypothetical protein